MKKFFSLLAVLAVTVFMGSTVFAAPKTIGSVVSSIANFSGAGEVSFSMDLKKISDDTSVDSIQWDVANIPLGVDATDWTTSTVYAVISATVTKANNAVYMYQDNKNGTSYVAVSSRTESGKGIYSGMVNKATQGGDYRGYIPMVFCSTTTKSTPNFGTEPEDVAGTRYFIDKSNTDFADQTNYITIANTGGLVGGVTSGGDCFNIGSNTGYMYFGGLFKNILGGDDWGTDSINIVSTIE